MEKHENQRITLTKRLVQEAFLLLLKTTDIHKMSVRDLCAKAGINRTTFYNHYSCPYDVLKEMSQNYLNAIESTLNSAAIGDHEEAHQRVQIVFHYMEDHLELSRILINNNLDISFHERLFSLPKVTQLLEETLTCVEDQYEKEAIISFAISGSCKLIQDWINAESRISPDQEAKLVLRLAKRVCSV